jgi:oligopeptide transport system substrate-binding protein
LRRELDSNDDIPTEQLADLKPSLVTRFASALSRHLLLCFQTDKAPWDNPKLRHAISEAIDRDYLAEKVWQNTRSSYSFVPPGQRL